ncbi:uncharacterized protein LOC142571331 isoform X2 [Dermacentor variabilis]|uniref:uncharacterized protein LOC142571331 isoform X2 n=1 Tax=Dermacentor variabilis TaxID=34621 RepID=UPI003F5BD773
MVKFQETGFVLPPTPQQSIKEPVLVAIVTYEQLSSPITPVINTPVECALLPLINETGTWSPCTPSGAYTIGIDCATSSVSAPPCDIWMLDSLWKVPSALALGLPSCIKLPRLSTPLCRLGCFTTMQTTNLLLFATQETSSPTRVPIVLTLLQKLSAGQK